MSAKFSSGLRNALAVTGSLKSLLAGGFLKEYAGTAPATADDALGSDVTLLRTYSVSSSGTGLTFADAATSGVLPKNATELWSGVSVAAGTATFFRFVAASDDGTASTTAYRIQGSIGTAGADLNVSTTTIQSGASHTINTFSITVPTN